MYTDLGSEPIFITLPIYFKHRASVLQACGNLSKGRSAAAAAAAAYLHHKRCQVQRLVVGHKQVDYYTLTYDFSNSHNFTAYISAAVATLYSHM